MRPKRLLSSHRASPTDDGAGRWNESKVVLGMNLIANLHPTVAVGCVPGAPFAEVRVCWLGERYSIDDATVTVMVKPSDTDEFTLTLLDNGIDADNEVGDGLYSAYFETTELGVYNAVAKITGVNGSSMSDIMEDECNSLGGNYRGDYTSCEIVSPPCGYGACCFDDGCLEVPG